MPDDMIRREFLRIVGLFGAGLAIDPSITVARSSPRTTRGPSVQALAYFWDSSVWIAGACVDIRPGHGPIVLPIRFPREGKVLDVFFSEAGEMGAGGSPVTISLVWLPGNEKIISYDLMNGAMINWWPDLGCIPWFGPRSPIGFHFEAHDPGRGAKAAAQVILGTRD